MGDIIIERNPTTVMKLDENEQALLDEIQIDDQPRVFQHKPKRRPRAQQTYDDQPEIDAFTNPDKQNAPKPPAPEMMMDDEDDDFDDEQYYGGGGEGGGGGGGGGDEYNAESQPSAGYTSIEDEKADLLNKITRLAKKGFHVNKSLNAYSDVSELRTEYKRITYSIDVDQSVKFSRRMLVACVTGLEFVNKRYNPLDVQLDGWSESVMENVEDYDNVFEELYVKYKSKMDVAPEVKLIMMLGGSAMMFHLTNSMFKAAIPNMGDVMKQNPDLMQNMMQAVQNSTRGGNAAPSGGAPPPPSDSGRREMQGPGMDISSLMGGIMMPPQQPMNTSMPVLTEEDIIDDLDNMSDIISVSGSSATGDLKQVQIKKSGKKRKSKKEISM